VTQFQVSVVVVAAKQGTYRDSIWVVIGYCRIHRPPLLWFFLDERAAQGFVEGGRVHHGYWQASRMFPVSKLWEIGAS
jgi:hypothetical protein